MCRNRIPPTVFPIQFSIFLPQQTHLFTLISSNVARRKCVRSRPTERVRPRNASLCRYELLPAKYSRKLFRFPGQSPDFLSQSATNVVGLIKLKDFPNRNLDYSWMRAQGKAREITPVIPRENTGSNYAAIRWRSPPRRSRRRLR